MSQVHIPRLNIDFNFIADLEGVSCQGYVPDTKNSRSGVTIASGFDIGQRSESEIKRAFSGDLCEKLLPYANKTKQAAIDALMAYPLSISQEEVQCINVYSYQDASQKLYLIWQQASPIQSFELLSGQCQTVIASVAFQYGDLSRRTPTFWRQVIQGQWQDAYENLRDFSDKYPSRRNKEADLLLIWLQGTAA